MSEHLIRLGLVDEEEIVLDEAALSLARLDHPGTRLTPYEEVIEAIAMGLDAVGDTTSVPRQRADALSQVMAGEFGFVGDHDTYDDPANADLICVLDRRRGLPVSLSILYVGAARRLGWTAYVLDVPGHVLVLIGEGASSIIIDPFRRGIPVQRDQLASMVSAMGPLGAGAGRHIAAMSNRAVLIRLLLNQATRAEQAGKRRRALELYRRMTVLAPGYSGTWWERARLELTEGDVAAARISLTAMLEVTREPSLRGRVANTLQALGP